MEAIMKNSQNKTNQSQNTTSNQTQSGKNSK